MFTFVGRMFILGLKGPRTEPFLFLPLPLPLCWAINTPVSIPQVNGGFAGKKGRFSRGFSAFSTNHLISVSAPGKVASYPRIPRELEMIRFFRVSRFRESFVKLNNATLFAQTQIFASRWPKVKKIVVA